MRFISIVIAVLLLFMIAFMYDTLGIGITMLVFAAIFLIMAVLFSIKGQYHDNFLGFMSPKLYNVYKDFNILPTVL